jgi:hypothetical protein
MSDIRSDVGSAGGEVKADRAGAQHMERGLMLLPMLGQVLLTLTVYVITLKLRVGAVKRDEMDVLYFKTKQAGEPTRKVKQGDELILNLFENPMLFFAGCLASIALDVVDGILLGLATIFVIARIIHAHEYLTKNRIRQRLKSWTIGLCSIFFFWIYLTWASLF